MDRKIDKRKKWGELPKSVMRASGRKSDSGSIAGEQGAVSKWFAQAKDGGKEALKSHPAAGGQSKLNVEQLALLPGLLAKGAEAYGFRGAVWTRQCIRQMIEDVFGVRYHVDHMSFLMQKIGWTQQKPIVWLRNKTKRPLTRGRRTGPKLKKSQKRRPNHSVQR